ncbi:MAG: SUMF1/EgtB/PvdO family nonheme iron enzyme [Bacteroidota bacterium]
MQPRALVFQATPQPVALDDYSQWWIWTLGANWRHPEGPQSEIKDRMGHPVVHMAWEDAQAYCAWAKKRLPTEAEWEWAARAGQSGAIYPWGNEAINQSPLKANFWQGLFPYQNTEEDGHLSTAPVRSFSPNAYGVYDMAGNVWEWCHDWYHDRFYQQAEASKANTSGPAQRFQAGRALFHEKVIRGGSFLCNDDYCSGYRNARRMGAAVDTGWNHTGFRCTCTPGQE